MLATLTLRQRGPRQLVDVVSKLVPHRLDLVVGRWSRCIAQDDAAGAAEGR